jgi:putative NADH-flavin reductase
MNVTVLGATGRTGRLLVAELIRRGHQVTVLVRDPARAPKGTRVVVGDSRHDAALGTAVTGADAVISALGPVGKDQQVHRDTAKHLIFVMRAAGVRRYIGVSGAGVDAAGDRKRTRDRIISAGMHLLARAMVADKTAELALWRGTDLDWTLVRPPRLIDGSPTGQVEHEAHLSTRSTGMRRSDLAVFLADVLENGLYHRQAPFAATTAKP